MKALVYHGPGKRAFVDRRLLVHEGSAPSTKSDPRAALNVILKIAP